jgi:hypothetical protein
VRLRESLCVPGYVSFSALNGLCSSRAVHILSNRLNFQFSIFSFYLTFLPLKMTFTSGKNERPWLACQPGWVSAWYYQFYPVMASLYMYPHQQSKDLWFESETRQLHFSVFLNIYIVYYCIIEPIFTSTLTMLYVHCRVINPE